MRRPRGTHWTLIYLMAVAMAAILVMNYGPDLERRLNPPATIRFGNPAIINAYGASDEPYMAFSIVGEQHRTCRLISLTFAWRFPNAIELADVYDSRTRTPFRPAQISYRSERFLYGPLYAPIPPPAYGVAPTPRSNATLRACAYYSCHAIWETPVCFSAAAALPLIGLEESLGEQ